MVFLSTFCCTFTAIKFWLLGSPRGWSLFLTSIYIALVGCKELVHWLPKFPWLLMATLSIPLKLRSPRSSSLNALNLTIIILIICQIPEWFLVSVCILLSDSLNYLVLLLFWGRCDIISDVSHAASCILAESEGSLRLTHHDILLIWLASTILTTWSLTKTISSF